MNGLACKKLNDFKNNDINDLKILKSRLRGLHQNHTGNSMISFHPHILLVGI